MSRDRDVIEKVIASLKNIGKFEVAPLRESENGACYKAVDSIRRISVSIRTLWPHDQPNGDEFTQKLLAQARAAQTLDQGNNAKVIGSGELDGAFFIVSSFIDGYSLRQNLQRGEHLNTWDLIDFARQSCVGLESAHARGIMHHALHPDNIVLEFDGSTKILDLGLFRPNHPDTDPYHPTAAYLAPEQLAGHGADRVTNFYSIAIMLYEIATGKLPFTGDCWEALTFSAQNDFPEPIKVNPSVPPGINAAIVKALSRDRSARFQSGPEMVRALEDYKSFGKPASPVVTPKPSTPKVVVINAVTPQTPVRNPYATARDLAESDIELESGPANASRASQEKASIVGLQDFQQTWKPTAAPAKAPEPEPEEEFFDEPYVDPPTKGELVTDFALRVGKNTWIASQRAVKKTSKKVDPWIAALSVLVIILGSFVARSIVLSFLGQPTVTVHVAQPTTTASAEAPAIKVPVAQPAPQPAAATPEVAQPEPVKSAPVAAKPQPQTAHKVEVVAPSSLLYSSAHPMPAPGYTSVMTGSVMISTTPVGAHVIVDGKGAGFTTPQLIPSLQPGVHTLTITKDGYAPATRPVQITAGAQSKLTVQLDFPSGFLTVMSNPSTAYIVVDGVSTGHVTPSQVPVAPGTHTLTLRKMGYLEASDSFAIKSGEQQSRNVSLLEAGSTPDIHVAQTSGVRKMFSNKVNGVRLTVRTTPPGATILINGQSVGKTTPVDFGLNPGNYIMEVQLTGYQTLHKTITVEENKPMVLDEALHP